jgi:ElaB/YqjD/DUF883 family membrane-anchored ribosome-binding protein
MDSNAETNEISTDEVTREKLISDLKTVAHDAEELIKATAGDLGEKAKAARARLSVALERARVTGRNLQEKAMAGAKATDKCIREHPYQAIGVAFALGLAFGLLIKRK